MIFKGSFTQTHGTKNVPPDRSNTDIKTVLTNICSDTVITNIDTVNYTSNF